MSELNRKNGYWWGQHANRTHTYRKSRRAKSSSDYETWIESDVSNTINLFDGGDTRATTLIVHETDNEERSVQRRSRGESRSA